MEKGEYRALLKSQWGKEIDIISDQQKGKEFPLLEKPFPVDAELVDRSIGVDGAEEFAVYIASVGKIRGQ